MGCNCGKKRARPHGPRPVPPQSFTIVTLTGKTATFARRLDAEAALRRAGGGSIRGA